MLLDRPYFAAVLGYLAVGTLSPNFVTGHLLVTCDYATTLEDDAMAIWSAASSLVAASPCSDGVEWL